MTEIWKDIKGFEGLYQVSNLGRIRSLDRLIIYKNGRKYNQKGKIIKLSDNGKGYNVFNVSLNSCTKQLKVYKIVAETFIPNPENKPEVDHINTIRNDDRVENLRWVTHKENCNNIITKKHYKESDGCKNLQDGKMFSKVVIQYSIEGDFIKEWSSTMEVQRELGIHNTIISKCCMNKPHYKTAGGFIWKYK